jgi:hypothetical protein
VQRALCLGLVQDAGFAQINGIDMTTHVLLADSDMPMLNILSERTYFRLILSTVLAHGAGDRANEESD